jgi:hypothetical protein
MPEGAGRNYVRFDRGSGQRIAAAVLQVERGNRDQPPITFNPALGGASSPKQIRMGTFTGAWALNANKTVTFRTTTSTPNTAVAVNIFAAIATSATSPRNCAIAKDGTAWYLIAAQCT